VQKHPKKNKGMHIREIQAFQKKIQTVYDPLHLSRTVYYAAKNLRDKINDKIPTMNFPPFTPSKYLFALHFKIKFPSLPTSKLVLAFRPPYPKWLPCNSLLGMKQSLITKEKDKVTPVKCNIYTFRGHLHLDLHHVRIISPSGIGKRSLQFPEQVINFIENTNYMFFHVLATIPLKAGDAGEDDDAGARTRSNPKQGHHLRKGRPPSQGKIRYETSFSSFSHISTNNILIGSMIFFRIKKGKLQLPLSRLQRGPKIQKLRTM